MLYTCILWTLKFSYLDIFSLTNQVSLFNSYFTSGKYDILLVVNGYKLYYVVNSDYFMYKI